MYTLCVAFLHGFDILHTCGPTTPEPRAPTTTSTSRPAGEGVSCNERIPSLLFRALNHSLAADSLSFPSLR